MDLGENAQYFRSRVYDRFMDIPACAVADVRMNEGVGDTRAILKVGPKVFQPDRKVDCGPSREKGIETRTFMSGEEVTELDATAIKTEEDVQCLLQYHEGQHGRDFATKAPMFHKDTTLHFLMSDDEFALHQKRISNILEHRAIRSELTAVANGDVQVSDEYREFLEGLRKEHFEKSHELQKERKKQEQSWTSPAAWLKSLLRVGRKTKGWFRRISGRHV